MMEATSSLTVTERDRLRRLASQHIIGVERFSDLRLHPFSNHPSRRC